MNDIHIPPPLQRGDKIMIVSPAGKVDEQFVTGAEKKLSAWGFDPLRAEHCTGTWGRFSGTAEERLGDMLKVLADDSVKGILCSRGGYGAVHLLDRLGPEIGMSSPKWLVGYSDITALHACFRSAGIASLHAPMCRHLSENDDNDFSSCCLKDILYGSFPEYRLPPHPLNRPGIAAGQLVGGNLSVLYGLRGTPFDFDPEGTILFLEDIGEAPYRIERMLYNFKLGGVLSRLSGLIIGQFTEYSEDPSFGNSFYEMIADLVGPYSYPVCFGFPVGHVKNNYPVIVGGATRLSVDGEVVCFSQFPNKY